MISSATLARAAVALAATLTIVGAAQATEEKMITNAHPASAASGADANRTMKFNTHKFVAGTLTSARDTAIVDGWSAEFRFSGQDHGHTCDVHFPKAGQVVKRGESAVMTVRCDTPWQLYDNGMGFEAFEKGRKVAEGTLRPS